MIIITIREGIPYGGCAVVAVGNLSLPAPAIHARVCAALQANPQKYIIVGNEVRLTKDGFVYAHLTEGDELPARLKYGEHAIYRENAAIIFQIDQAEH